MSGNIGFGRIKEERKNLSFFKIFQEGADLSSECMRALPYSFMKSISRKDFSYRMVIRAQWGSSWEVVISKNPRFYYMEKLGWSQFVSDNALGKNEFITFTHKGHMCFNVNIFEQSGKEIVIPRKPPTMRPPPSSGIKTEQGESFYVNVKKEDETGESMGEVELEVKKKAAENSKTSKKNKSKSKKVVNSVEIGESSRRAELKFRKEKAEKFKTSMEKKKKIKIPKAKSRVPKFKITIKKSYLKFLGIPKRFEEHHIPNESKKFTIHHSEGKGSWEVLCLVRQTRTIFSGGWSQLAREFPLSVGDRCTFQLIKPTEILLTIKKGRKKRSL